MKRKGVPWENLEEQDSQDRDQQEKKVNMFQKLKMTWLPGVQRKRRSVIGDEDNRLSKGHILMYFSLIVKISDLILILVGKKLFISDM